MWQEADQTQILEDCGEIKQLVLHSQEMACIWKAAHYGCPDQRTSTEGSPAARDDDRPQSWSAPAGPSLKPTPGRTLSLLCRTEWTRDAVRFALVGAYEFLIFKISCAMKRSGDLQNSAIFGDLDISKIMMTHLKLRFSPSSSKSPWWNKRILYQLNSVGILSSAES